MAKKNSYSDEEIDQLREICNIGCGHSATALSDLTGLSVVMSVPNVAILKPEELLDILRDEAENVGVLITAGLVGDLEGRFSLIIPSSDAGEMIQAMRGRPMVRLDLLNAMESSLLIETGNILIGSFTTALVDMLELDLQFEVPRLAVDMLSASLSSVALEMGLESEIVFTVLAKLLPLEKFLRLYFQLVLTDPSIRILSGKLKQLVARTSIRK